MRGLGLPARGQLAPVARQGWVTGPLLAPLLLRELPFLLAVASLADIPLLFDSWADRQPRARLIWAHFPSHPFPALEEAEMPPPTAEVEVSLPRVHVVR